LVEKLLHFWVLLRFWFKIYYISGFYYDSGSKVTTFLVLLHFWLFTAFLGQTGALGIQNSNIPVFIKPCQLSIHGWQTGEDPNEDEGKTGDFWTAHV